MKDANLKSIEDKIIKKSHGRSKFILRRASRQLRMRYGDLQNTANRLGRKVSLKMYINIFRDGRQT